MLQPYKNSQANFHICPEFLRFIHPFLSRFRFVALNLLHRGFTEQPGGFEDQDQDQNRERDTVAVS